MPLSVSFPLLPPDLGTPGRGGVAAPHRGPSCTCTARGASAAGRAPHQCPARRGSLLGWRAWGWRWQPSAVVRETEDWASKKGTLDLLQGRLPYIWKGQELRPVSQHGGGCWHWRALF